MDDIYSKCMICKRKILTESSICKCKDNFCGKHLYSHQCTYDYKKNKMILDKIIADKVVKI